MYIGLFLYMLGNPYVIDQTLSEIKTGSESTDEFVNLIVEFTSHLINHKDRPSSSGKTAPRFTDNGIFLQGSSLLQIDSESAVEIIYNIGTVPVGNKQINIGSHLGNAFGYFQITEIVKKFRAAQVLALAILTQLPAYRDMSIRDFEILSSDIIQFEPLDYHPDLSSIDKA
jgi:hypothetical protein